MGQDRASAVSAPPGYSWQFLEHSPRLQSVLQTSLSSHLGTVGRARALRHSVTESYRRCFITTARFSSRRVDSAVSSTTAGWIIRVEATLVLEIFHFF